MTAPNHEALEWLSAELETASPDQKKMIAQTLAHWQKDSDLASIRETSELEKLTPIERESWETLWKRVAALLEQLDSPK